MPTPPPVPLLPSQETIWEFLSCFHPDDPGRSGFNLTGGELWHVPVDRAAFDAAVAEVSRRHESLRTVFVDSGLDARITFEPDLAPPVGWHDLAGLTEQEQEERVGQLSADQHGSTFDLASGPLWTVHVVRLAADRHLVMVCLFHMIADGWSVGVLLRDLAAAYRLRLGPADPADPAEQTGQADPTGQAGPPRQAAGEALPGPGLRLAEIAERARATPERRAARAAYWRQRLDPLPDRFAFPARDPGPDADLAAQAAVDVTFSRLIADDLMAFAARQRTTPFIALLAAYRVLLARWTGWHRVVIGTTTLGRDLPGSRHLVGQFTVNLYVATTLAPEATLLDVLGEIHREVLAGVQHAASFTEIARAVNPAFDRQRPWPFLNLYDAWFQAVAPAESDDPGPLPATAGRALDVPAGSRARWVAAMPPCPEALRMHAKRGEPGFMVHDIRAGGSLAYNPAFYPEEMVRPFAVAYPQIIEMMLTEPSRRLSTLT